MLLLALLLVLLCSGIYKRFDFNESYFTIHSFFAPIIADAIILYMHKVSKTFNRHLNLKCEFSMITMDRLYVITFAALHRSLTLSSLLLSLATTAAVTPWMLLVTMVNYHYHGMVAVSYMPLEWQILKLVI